MAVTHADLRPGRRSTELGSKTGAFLVVLCIFFGLFCFILCIIAETTRSQVSWLSISEGGQEERYECTYSGSGKTAVLCAGSAFMALAIAMVVQHTYLLVAVSKSTPPDLITWDLDSDFAKSLTWQPVFFFTTTWICFAVGEILLLIGISIESGHLKHWSMPRPSCLVIKQGLFSAAGVFGLTTVCFAAGLYITALRAQSLLQGQENVRREVWEASALYASPPRTPGHRHTTVANESTVARQNQDEYSLAFYLFAFDKNSNFV